jgi:GNAT superfamily N-acetyltransferase
MGRQVRVLVRRGGPGDAAAMLALFDDAVRWLAANGREGQWGTVPFSLRPDMVLRVEAWARSGDLRVVEDGAGRVVGTLVLGAAPGYAPAAAEPELYLQAFATDRRVSGAGVGAALLDRAREEAIEQDVQLLRVDCWAGGDGALVRYYVRAGFTPTQLLSVGGWPAQLFEQRLDPDGGGGPP